MRVARWKAWLEDPNVRRWHENMQRGSEVTADEFLRVLYRYLTHERHAHLRLTPRTFLEWAKKDRDAVEIQLHDFIVLLEKQGKSPGYIPNYVKAVKSWLTYNGVALVRKFNVRDAGRTPTLEDERVPTSEEVRSIFSNATPRGRVIISFMAFSGVRPEVLGNARATDGLRVRDLPEMRIEGQNVVFDKIPTRVVVRMPLSKAGHQYFTFLPQEGCNHLKDYLEQRMAAGEKLEPDSPVVRVTEGWNVMGRRGALSGSPFIISANVSREVREAIRPRHKWRPYVLRAYFDTQLLIAESAGAIPHSFRAFFMGHKGDIEARYTTNKGRLPPDLIASMRNAYDAATQYLETAVRRPENPLADMLKIALHAEGRSDDEIVAMALDQKPKEELYQLFEALLLKKREPVNPRGYGMAAPPEQKIVAVTDLDVLLTQGWAFKASLPDGRVIIDRPPGRQPT